MTTWKKFNALELIAAKGVNCRLTVRGPGRPEVEVWLNQFGQPIRVDTGRLLEPAPTEYAEVPAPAVKPSKDSPKDSGK